MLNPIAARLSHIMVTRHRSRITLLASIVAHAMVIAFTGVVAARQVTDKKPQQVSEPQQPGQSGDTFDLDDLVDGPRSRADGRSDEPPAPSPTPTPPSPIAND